jgi:hypothetical protein
MSETQVGRVQKDLEKTVEALRVATDYDERKFLLRRMKMLIDEADGLISESGASQGVNGKHR